MHRLDDRSDEVLVELAARGESGSLAILVERHRRKALRIAYGILHNPSDAEDAVQDAFIRACKNLSAFHGSGKFSAWLYRIVVNESVRLIRSRRSVEEAELTEECAAVAVPDTEHVLLVRQCLASLPEKLRVVLALRGVEELDYSEIAEVLSVPVGTVRSRLHDARKQFAGRWKELMEDEM